MAKRASAIGENDVEDLARRSRFTNLAQLPLVELIPEISPEHRPPWHLADWCAILDRAAAGEALRAGCAVPIRHYKSETTFHGVIKILLVDPTTPIIFLTHSHERAVAVGKRIRKLAEIAGVGPARGFDTINDWRNDKGGGVVVMSADQSKLGYDCGVLIYDDPLDERGWDNPQVRDAVDGAIVHYTARCMRKGKPGPVLGVMSRGHRDDPFGRRITRAQSGGTPFEYVHRRAIWTDDDGVEHAFAPEVWDLPALRDTRMGLAEKDPTEKIWWSQFQNEPITTGGDLFHEPTRYTELPTWAYKVVMGADFAFSQGQHADYFALVVGRLYGKRLYITEVRRERIDATLIESTIKAARAKHGRAPVYSYQSGPEKGLTSILNERGCQVVSIPARYNKLVRAERTIRRWNQGDILVPEDGAALWVPGFLSRVSQFRGVDADDGDDEVDALVSMADGLFGGGEPPRVFGTPRI